MELYVSDKATIPEKIEINNWYVSCCDNENTLEGQRFYDMLGDVVIQINWATYDDSIEFSHVKNKYNLIVYLDYIYTYKDIVLLNIYDTSIENCLKAIENLVIYRDDYSFDENNNLIDSNDIIIPEHNTKFKKWEIGKTISWENEELSLKSTYKVPNSTKKYVARIIQYCDEDTEETKFNTQLCYHNNDKTTILKSGTFNTFQGATKFLDTFKIVE